MKFVHVSIFAFTSLCGADEPIRLSGRSPHENDHEAYLDEVFPGKFTEKERDRVLDLLEREDGNTVFAESGFFRDADETGGPCRRPGVGPRSPIPKKVKRLSRKEKSWPKKLKDVGYYDMLNFEDAVKGWCCSKKSTQNMAREGSRDEGPGVCDCKHKGEKAGINGGLVCCSQYAVEKDGEMVCGGIPPTGVMQPLQTGDYSYEFIINLSVSDCMFPESGTEKEESRRVSRWTGPDWASETGLKKGDMLACAKRKCQSYGKKPTDEKPICCGGTQQDGEWDRPADPKDKVCGCAHAGQHLSAYTTAGAGDCCADRFDGNGAVRMCDCILDHHEKPPGAADTDCCSGLVRERLNKKWCQPTECVEQGKLMKGKGGRCCASTSTGLTYNWTLPCGCVPGGTVQAEKNGARCCSKEINSTTQKCKWKPPKGKVEEHFNETECFSGQMNEDKLCLCMAPFSRMRHKDDVAQNREKCCSGYTISKEGSPHHGLCGCIKNGDKLGFGSDESHCCSGSAVGGVCTCIPPGGKFSAGEGMTKYECCSSRAGSEFCLCSSSNSSGSPNACCTDLAADGSCPCIRDGHALPLTESENPDAVCCSEQTPKQKEQCSRTCGKAEAVPDRKKDPAEDEPDCYDESVQEQLANMCKLPGELIFEEFRCQRCQKSEKSSWDSYPRCRVKCCDTAVDVKDDMCQCTPYGRSYDFTTSWPVGLASAGSAAKCCGRNAQDQASLLRKGVCGCSTVGASVGIGGTEADCCSEKMEDGICVPGACAKKGERGRCCRVASDMRMRLNLGICPCFHSGEVPNPSDDVTWENCCSGGKNDAGTACGCVSDPKLTLHKTAQDSDCCSGKRTPDKQHCVAPASDCLRVGVEAQDEEKCCSKSKDETNKCKCIPSGKDVPAGGTASDCCSGKFKGETRVCARLETGGPVPNGTKPEDVCLSGRLDAGSDNELKCGCVSPGKKAPDSSQCCSNDLSSSGTCQCIPHGSALNGGTEEFCCSGLASATGVCLCAPPGAPPKGRAEEMCCSKIYGSKDLHCGCLGKNAQLSSPDEGVHCCGGFFNFIPEKLRCRCLEDGHAIQKWVKEDACCSDKKNGDVCR